MFDLFDDPFGTGVAEPEYPFLRRALAQRYRHAPAATVERVVEAALSGAHAEAIEDWMQTMATIGQALLPLAAGALGTAVAGPPGGVVGGTLGGAAAGAIGGATARADRKSARGGGRPRRRRRRTQGPRAPAHAPAAIKAPASGPGPARPARAGAAAGCPPAGALVGLLVQPEVLLALLALALGKDGAPVVDPGGVSTPVASVASLLGWLADQAAAQQAAWPAADQRLPDYLLDDQGRPRVDVSLPEGRARALLEVFHEEAEAALEADEEASAVEQNAVDEMVRSWWIPDWLN